MLASSYFADIKKRIEWMGDEQLFSRPRRALLISRTKRNPSPSTPWVRAVIGAVESAVKNGEVLVTGLGRTPFDLALAACRRARGSAIVVLESSQTWQQGQYYADGLLPSNVLFVRPKGIEPSDPKISAAHSKVPLRDRLLGILADRAEVIAVRKAGNMARVLDQMTDRGCRVDRSPLHKTLPKAKGTGPEPTAPEPTLATVLKPGKAKDWPYLTHYTREPDERWPGESPGEYANWLLNAPLDEHRGARESLKRILTSGILYGSGRLFPGKTPGISFTERGPWQASELMRWRTGLHRWTFRPFGIGIRRQALKKLGARKIRYLSRKERTQLASDDLFFSQLHEPPQTDWSAEAEWRIRGHLDLTQVAPEDVILLARTEVEAQMLREAFGFDAMGIYEDRLKRVTL